MSGNLLRTAFASTYPPVNCGLGSFANRLGKGLLEDQRIAPLSLVAMDPTHRRPKDYPGIKLLARLRKSQPRGYEMAADLTADAGIEAVIVNHEYGPYGGEWTSVHIDGEWHKVPTGKHLLRFLRRLKQCGVKIVVVLHTVVMQPDPVRKEVLRQVVLLADAAVSLTNGGRNVLIKDYQLDDARIEVISHGVPVMPNLTQAEARQELGLKLDIPLFVMLGYLKQGTSQAIRALAQVRKAGYPTAELHLAGCIHPNTPRKLAAEQRLYWDTLIASLGLRGAVHITHDYASDREQTRYNLSATARYGLNPDRYQYVSGVLPELNAVGPTIATRFLHAEEILPDEYLVDIGDADSLAGASIALLEGKLPAWQPPTEDITWPAIGGRFADLTYELARS